MYCLSACNTRTASIIQKIGAEYKVPITPKHECHAFSFSGYGDTEKVSIDWGNPFDSCEILQERLPYLYGMDTAEWWEPTAAQERKYNQKQKTLAK